MEKLRAFLLLGRWVECDGRLAVCDPDIFPHRGMALIALIIPPRLRAMPSGAVQNKQPRTGA